MLQKKPGLVVCGARPGGGQTVVQGAAQLLWLIDQKPGWGWCGATPSLGISPGKQDASGQE